MRWHPNFSNNYFLQPTKYYYGDCDRCHTNVLQWSASHCIHSYAWHLLPCIFAIMKLPRQIAFGKSSICSGGICPSSFLTLYMALAGFLGCGLFLHQWKWNDLDGPPLFCQSLSKIFCTFGTHWTCSIPPLGIQDFFHIVLNIQTKSMPSWEACTNLIHLDSCINLRDLTMQCRPS